MKIWSKLSMSAAYEKNVKLTGIRKVMPSTRVTCWCADKVFAISDAVKKEVSEQIGFENKIKVIHAPVPVEKYLSATGVGIREEFKFKDSDLVLVSVGHFAEVKGWDISVQAFVEVRKKIPQAKLLLVGKTTSQSFYNKIVTLIKVNDLQGSVVFAGNRSDIPNILKASDIFIFPSRSEGAGAALIEAMAAGIPCIGTNTGGIPGIIEDGVNGFLFERENVSDLSKKILDLIIDSELKIQFCTAAEEKLVNFTIESYVEGIFNQYQALLLNR
ncbi:glycosyltransferase family 4 protein [Psychromonas sp. KJ10-2]|uniref:glycosyltransferase family 4 protein n=1 Tax=Psychromonas sp. KJ10-2 TaxID=3391822 RepID=UPI0039B6B6C5